MRLLFLEHYHTAKSSLKRTRVRTLLTILGIAIGVGSITAIMSLGSGITGMINKQANDAGDTIAVIRPHVVGSGIIGLGNPTPPATFTTSPLDQRDFETLKDNKKLTVVPIMTLSGNVRSTDERPKNASVLSTTPDFPLTTPITISDGQFIDSTTLDNTAVLGQQLAIDLFGTPHAVGKRLYIRGQTFTCIGVLKRLNNPINYNNIDLDHAAIISLDSGKLFNGGVTQIQQMNIKVHNKADLASEQAWIKDILKKNHDGLEDVDVVTGQEITKPTNLLFLTINTLMALIASISLLVGGIGIMNIMLVSVAERTREIGLRKAVGASNKLIVVQFMTEALMMSFLGGVAGFVGGYIFAFFASLLLPYDPAFSWDIVGWAAGLSLGVGVIFGIYPALKAARKDPIQSLRQYH